MERKRKGKEQRKNSPIRPKWSVANGMGDIV
jgi:hypothetical protein